MNKEDLYPLIGKFLNGYKIVKIEEDPFIKGQINLWTDEWTTEFFGDQSIVKFFIRPDSNSSKIYKELIDKEIYQLKDNWDELKEYIRTEYKRLHGILETPTEFEMMALLKVVDKMGEIEEGHNDSNR